MVSVCVVASEHGCVRSKCKQQLAQLFLLCLALPPALPASVSRLAQARVWFHRVRFEWWQSCLSLVFLAPTLDLQPSFWASLGLNHPAIQTATKIIFLSKFACRDFRITTRVTSWKPPPPFSYYTNEESGIQKVERICPLWFSLRWCGWIISCVFRICKIITRTAWIRTAPVLNMHLFCLLVWD